MVEEHLDQAIKALKELLDITQKDIENIQKGDNSALDASTKRKGELVSEFEQAKRALDCELVKMAQENPQSNLADVLDNNVKERLAELKEVLLTLKEKNKNYAKSVLVVKEFLDSLAVKIFGGENSEYSSIKQNDGKFYKARV